MDFERRVFVVCSSICSVLGATEMVLYLISGNSRLNLLNKISCIYTQDSVERQCGVLGPGDGLVACGTLCAPLGA